MITLADISQTTGPARAEFALGSKALSNAFKYSTLAFSGAKTAREAADRMEEAVCNFFVGHTFVKPEGRDTISVHSKNGDGLTLVWRTKIKTDYNASTAMHSAYCRLCVVPTNLVIFREETEDDS